MSFRPNRTRQTRARPYRLLPFTILFQFTLGIWWMALSTLGPVAGAEDIPSGCYSLATSKYCGEAFGDYHLSQYIQVAGRKPTSASQLDNVLDQYFNSRSDIADTNMELGCTNWNGNGTPRYRMSYLCRSYLALPASQSCNANQTPPPLCKDTCLKYTNGWENVIANVTACPNQGISKIIVSDLVASCDSSFYGGSDSDRCVDGAKVEASTCGLIPTDTASICSFCSGPSSELEPCCRTAIPANNCPNPPDEPNFSDSDASRKDDDSSGWTAGRIAAVVVPTVVGALLLLALLAFLIYRQRRKRQLEHNKLFPHVPKTSPSSQHLLTTAPGALAAVAAANGSVQSFEPVQCRAIYPFIPRMDDELQLTQGDVLLLLKIFDDGWAVANNLTTGQEGAVPLVCVTPYQPDSSDEKNETTTSMSGSDHHTSDGLSAVELERSLSSMNASAAAIAATVSAITGSHGTINQRLSGRVHESQLPRRYSSRRAAHRPKNTDSDSVGTKRSASR
ncbi:hypothetical protein IWQ62_000711 [Dispira parvispora]|uniref:SH3 domain-containing protein n=1 Tax=Dispira parvispora TaxID=1520584 RepID=A0A9W8B0P3_9FUNG|nr:hypothetical protein IWQ62_000711 [Dispira parvispora]